MEEHFAFLKNAKPAGLFRLAEKLPGEDAALMLAGLPPALNVQVMAYFSEQRQAELVPALREARRAEPARAAAAAERVKTMLAAAKNVRADTAPPPSPPADKPSVARPSIGKPSAGPPSAPPPASSPAAADSPARRPVPPRPGVPPRPAEPARNAAPPPSGKPSPWIPRAATSSPINGPALPGKPPPLVGDPMESPLAKAGLLDLIGRAQQRFLPKGKTPPPPAKAGQAAKPGPAARPSPAARPEPREGVARSVEVSKTRRVIGPGPARPRSGAAPDAAGEGSRRMDGKAILAAILRAADAGVRENVRHDDPGLFRELRGRMFYFDDLAGTGDADLARVFTAAPAAEAALALKFAAPALRDRVLRVVSPGRAEALRSVPFGRAGFDAVELAQKKVLDVALQLQAAGRILIDPGDPDLAG